MLKNISKICFCLLAVNAPWAIARTDDSADKPVEIKLARGKLQMVAPKQWKRTKPRSSMLAFEFSAPGDAKEGDPTARITIMRAGGSIDANIERWYGQFTQPDGKSTKDRAKLEKFEVDGTKVHWVDITGDFKESMGGGPFAPGKTVVRKEHRMIGSIVVADDGGQYFIKMTGPAVLLKKLEEDYKKMLKELKFEG